MARIVLVHGAFNELWGPHELLSRWVPALRDGLWHHGLGVEEGDVDACFYGDLFRRAPGSPAEAAFERSRAGVADALTAMGGDALAAFSQAANEAVFDRTVDLLTTIRTEPDLRREIRRRFDAVVDHSTAVVVAHSLGTVVAYEALAARDDVTVDLVTLGSPLGIPMVFGALEPAPVDGRGVWPVGVRQWVNVAAVGDRAATVSHLAPLFGERVTDHLVDNGHRAHDPEPYLNSVPTGAAVAAALRARGAV